MLSLNTKLYYATVNYMYPAVGEYWDGLYNSVGRDARLWLNMAKYLKKNNFIARHGSWTSPWNTEIVPGFEMPVYDPKFSLSFEEITHLRALDIKNLITHSGSRVVVYYSGGIDSTLCLVALLLTLSSEELKWVDVSLSSESIIENPYFFEKHIINKFNIIDSSKLRYSDVEDLGNYAITCDQGDSIFGTELGTQMYGVYSQLLQKISPTAQLKLEKLRLKIADADTHFSEYADMIIAYFNLERDPQFGHLFYEKVVQNIKSSSVPIRSLHDFYWWLIFNLKYMECALRSRVYYYDGQNRKQSTNQLIINWFNHENYQKWSLVNNNNGQKIRGASAATYKWAAKKYIYAFDKNEWYLKYKSKLPSLKNIFARNAPLLAAPHIFAMDQEYNLLYLEDPEVKKFIEESLACYA